jgi:hypothetical protein
LRSGKFNNGDTISAKATSKIGTIVHPSIIRPEDLALPLEKSGPKTALILVMAAAGGLGFGVAVGFLRELMDGSFYTSEQVESAFQTPCIAVVASLKSDNSYNGPTLMGNPKPMLPFDRGLGAGLNSQRIISRDRDISWAVLNAPFSRFAEAIRSIKLAVDLNGGAVNCKRVTVSPRRFLRKESRRLQLVWRCFWLRQAHELSWSIVIFAIHHCRVGLPQTLIMEFLR